MNKERVLGCFGMSKCFVDGKTRLEVLKPMDFEVFAGECVAITGFSGSGKSTFLHCLAGLDNLDQGSVEIAGQMMTGLSDNQLSQLRNRYLGFIYQFHHLLSGFNTLENVMMPLLIRSHGQTRTQIRDEAKAMLCRVGLAKQLKQRVNELSGGERQRVAIARALVAHPRCVLADEPTGNLDQKNTQAVGQLILELNQALGTAFVIVTHNPILASKMQHQWLLADGRLKAYSRS